MITVTFFWKKRYNHTSWQLAVGQARYKLYFSYKFHFVMQLIHKWQNMYVCISLHFVWSRSLSKQYAFKKNVKKFTSFFRTNFNELNSHVDLWEIFIKMKSYSKRGTSGCHGGSKTCSLTLLWNKTFYCRFNKKL